jgi:hypothetical protein
MNDAALDSSDVDRLAPVALLETGDAPTGEEPTDYHDEEDDDELTVRDDADEEGDQ